MSIGNGDDDFKILLVPWGGASNEHWDDWDGDLDFKMRMNNMRRVHVMTVRMIILLVLWGGRAMSIGMMTLR